MNVAVLFVLGTHRRGTRTGHCALRSGRMTELLLLLLRRRLLLLLVRKRRVVWRWTGRHRPRFFARAGC